ncbi:WG repeat-containing protein [Anabaena sphaerica FACHB-251]|uniref:WG repeat-containing protein n=1 Tax=Anabaena sphaerica FACHB-251 TaxID=2692883 RepID=A0A927A149_9NOST|nr:WG repeat-containing protein [Anabaena sphaerica]MBD2295687.1 WG repeat-containing protein [Anabaena sphaerica FACHB-251]
MDIRGVWITTTDSKVLNSKDNIAEAMKFLADTGFNVVFPVVWNQGFTNYRSEVMLKNFGVEINPREEFKKRDPLAELIAEAKKVNLAVIPWFEYGFMSSYQRNGGHIIAKKPKWAAIDYAGKNLSVNDYYWLNALDSEVQEFLLSLFLEVVKKYEVVGIQGDDHFPCFPMEGGYDEKTTARYQQEFNQQPPKPPERGNSKDPQWQNPQWKQWVRWRADILSNFLSRVYREIIKVNPELIISMAPSIYPWGYENYLQDSQTWVDLGLVDLIHPQLYQRELELYKRDINRLVANQFNKQQLPQLIPGILLKQSTYRIDTEHLYQAVKYNRSVGIQGEVFWFYEGLRENNNALANILKSSIYSQPPGKFDAKEIKNNTFTHRRINNDYCYITTSEEISLKVAFDWVEPFSEGMAALKMGYKWGFIDKTGKLISRLQFDTAAPFSEGLALVSIKNKYRYIDKTGQFIPVKTVKEWDDGSSFFKGIVFDDGASFSEGMAAVKIADKWGYIDQTGKIIIPARFDDAKSFSEDMAAVKIANQWGYISKTGETIILSQFDDATSFSEGLALVKVGNKLGYIDRTGQFIINPQFDEADIFSEGLAPAKLGKKWGYINQYAEFIIPPNFDFAKPFSQKMALVNVGGELKQDQEQEKAYFTGGKWGYIRKP